MAGSDLLDEIRSEVGDEHIVTRLRDDGCRVYMNGIFFDRVLVDLESVSSQKGRGGDEGSRCDYVLFYTPPSHQSLVAVPMELKSGKIDSVSNVISQLQSGSKYAEGIMESISQSFNSICHPVLFYGRKIHKKDENRLNRGKIRFMDDQLTIVRKRCNRSNNLKEALDSIILE